MHNQTLSFPCKAVYEHLNCTLEGKIESDKRHSEVDHPTDPPPPFDEAVAQGGGLPPAPPPSAPEDAGDGQVAPVPPVPVPTFDPYPPVNAGSKGDTCIFRGVKGDLVKLDKNGRPYPVREDGFRLLKTTRPVGWEPDAWDTMRGFNRKPRPGAVVKVEPAPGVPIAGVDQAGGSSASGLDRSVDPPPPAAASVSETTAAEDPVGTRCRFIESPNDMHAAVSDIQESSVPTHVKNTQHGPCVPAVAACVVECACAPVGIMGLLNSDDSLVTSWLAECKALAAPAVKDDSDDEIEIEDVADEDQEPPWVHWERIAQEHNEYLKPSSDAAVAVAAAKGTVTTQLRDSDNDLVPAMPTVADDKSNDFKSNFSDIVDHHKHRKKGTPRRFPFNALVARPVNKKEIERTPKAQEAMNNEWKRLIDKHVWDMSVVRDMSDVASEAKNKNKEIQFGWLFGICVEKNSELPTNNPARKFKGRVVFQGNRVVNQNWDMAVFQDMGNSPATMDASRACDCFGCFPGHNVQIADAEQAYIQADLKGNDCWITLPHEQVPASWKKKYPNIKRPVVRLVKALYGHPDSGSFWEEHCDVRVKIAGFEPMGATWPSTYFHPKLKLYLVIYVDDFKLAGPKENLAKGWSLLQDDITIEKPQPIGLFLGCTHEMGSFKLPSGKLATSMTYNMEGFLVQCTERYTELAGGNVRFKKVSTPFLVEDAKDGPAGTPAAKGPVVECPWCLHTYPPPAVHKNINELDAFKSKTGRPPAGADDCEDGSAPEATVPGGDTGKMGKHAACILMKCLYAARMARFDLLRAITHLACQITRWTSECDRKLYRLICYIHSSLHIRLVGWIGDDGSLLQPHLFADADFAGCAATQRSTSGLHMAVRALTLAFRFRGRVRGSLVLATRHLRLRLLRETLVYVCVGCLPLIFGIPYFRTNRRLCSMRTIRR